MPHSSNIHEIVEQILDSIIENNQTDRIEIASFVGKTLGNICKEVFSSLGIHNMETYAGDAFSLTVGEGSFFEEEVLDKEELSLEIDNDIDDMFFEDLEI